MNNTPTDNTPAARQAERQTYLASLRQDISDMREATHAWLEVTRQAKDEREAFVSNLKQDVANMQTQFRGERLATHAAAEQARQDFVATVRQDVARDLDEFQAEFVATRQVEAGNRHTFLQNLQDKTQALLQEAKADLSQQSELAKAQRVAFLERLRESLTQDLDSFHDKFMVESQAARDSRQSYVEDLATQTQTLLEDARTELLEQHRSGQAARDILLNSLRDEIGRDLAAFRTQFAQAVARERQERKDYLAAQVQAGLAERARYHRQYRRDPQQTVVSLDVPIVTVVDPTVTEPTTVTPIATKLTTQKPTSSPKAPSPASGSSIRRKKPQRTKAIEETNLQEQISSLDETAKAVLALVEQTPGSSLTALTSKLEGVGRGTVEKHLQALIGAGHIKARNRGYYLVVTPQHPDNDLDGTELGTHLDDLA